MGARSAGLLRTSLPPLIAFVIAAAPGLAQPRDTNAPYEDAYDVLHGDDLVGEWQGTVSGSSVSQGDGQIGGQARFVKRGYEGKESFGLVLHDQRNRDGLEFSEISIGSIPCGPEPHQSPLVHGLELQDAPAGSATLLFQNVTAKAQPGMRVHPGYAPTADKPATLQTRWTDNGLSLRISGQLISVVAPVQGATFDYERQGDGRLDTLNLNLELTLARTHETEDLYQATLCDEPEHFEVLWTDPLKSKENVALSGAWFDVEFTEALHEGSFSPATVMMMTRDPDNGYIYVDADYSLEGRATLRITPNERLRSGTIYEIVIAGDRDGVVEHSLLGDPLVSEIGDRVAALVLEDALVRDRVEGDCATGGHGQDRLCTLIGQIAPAHRIHGGRDVVITGVLAGVELAGLILQRLKNIEVVGGIGRDSGAQRTVQRQ